MSIGLDTGPAGREPGARYASRRQGRHCGGGVRAERLEAAASRPVLGIVQASESAPTRRRSGEFGAQKSSCSSCVYTGELEQLEILTVDRAGDRAGQTRTGARNAAGCSGRRSMPDGGPTWQAQDRYGNPSMGRQSIGLLRNVRSDEVPRPDCHEPVSRWPGVDRTS